MDISAINLATTCQLQEFGLSLGDSIVLKAFAAKEKTQFNTESENRKEELGT